MRGVPLSTLALKARLALMRIDAVTAAGVLLCVVGLIAWAWGIPHLRLQVKEQQRTLQQLQRRFDESARLPKPVATSAQERMADFYDSLGEQNYAEQQVKTLFDIAGKSGLSLEKGEYKLGYDSNGRYYSYQILLPVKGAYPAIRQFCEQALLSIPFASLDEMGFKRDAISNNTLEAHLRFTLYLGEARAVKPAAAESDES